MNDEQHFEGAFRLQPGGFVLGDPAGPIYNFNNSNLPNTNTLWTIHRRRGKVELLASLSAHSRSRIKWHADSMQIPVRIRSGTALFTSAKALDSDVITDCRLKSTDMRVFPYGFFVRADYLRGLEWGLLDGSVHGLRMR